VIADRGVDSAEDFTARAADVAQIAVIEDEFERPGA
jgi:hypothetical protein